MSKYCCIPRGNIRPKFESQFIIIATFRPYTEEIKNSNNGKLPGRFFFYKISCDILISNIYSTFIECNFNISTDQIIRKLIAQYEFELYATDKAFITLTNSSTIKKIICQDEYPCFFFYLTCVLFSQYQFPTSQ